MDKYTPTDWNLPVEDSRNDEKTFRHYGLSNHFIEKGWVRLGGLFDSEDWHNPFPKKLRKSVAPILVVEMHGNYYIKDGHHRADRAYRDGYTHIGAWIAKSSIG